ncbi:Sialic acid-binding periplasmic protein SiaP precursor [Pseudobythopirellula maris]|uniref:Sialic acid-binding periplasmic protein SiaP n=1 Tax=Pseudobythopirellula maris TaxID=2527991 RepID=A0A5C5ZJE5_9BACT|nr:TRAP transporter substrate-binding protein DctP [Pseudobythopirellula maris]TWT87137.1 Sialic acid-binding periplasmic protein SiaP precursor [Pseudobythopirellula maris]
MKRWLLLLLVASLGCGEARTGGDGPRVWRFAIEESEGSVQHAYALEFERRVERASGGEIDVVVYPYGPLGTSTQMTEQLNLGAIEFAMASPGSIGKFIPETQAFLLHFVLSHDDAVNQRALASPELLAAFDKLYAAKGWKLLSIFPEGEMVWTTQKEIRRPDDFRGVKIRVMTSPILLHAYNAYGASATPLPYSEVYSALQLGMVDAQVNPVFAIERQKFYEVTDWLIFPGHAHFVTTAAANREFYEGQTESDRRLIDDTIAALNGYIFDRQVAFQTDRLKTIIAAKKARGARLGLCGDFTNFLAALTPEERAELVDCNELLTITPPLTSGERQAFASASEAVQQTYLDTGGPDAERMLRLIEAAVTEAE